MITCVSALAAHPDVDVALLTRTVRQIGPIKVLIASWIHMNRFRLEITNHLGVVHNRIHGIGDLHLLNQPIGFIVVVWVGIIVKARVDESGGFNVAEVLVEKLH